MQISHQKELKVDVCTVTLNDLLLAKKVKRSIRRQKAVADCVQQVLSKVMIIVFGLLLVSDWDILIIMKGISYTFLSGCLDCVAGLRCQARMKQSAHSLSLSLSVCWRSQ